jgi:hypothetical protein
MAGKLLAQVTTFEAQIEILSRTIVHQSTELRDKNLGDDLLCQNLGDVTNILAPAT